VLLIAASILALRNTVRMRPRFSC